MVYLSVDTSPISVEFEPVSLLDRGHGQYQWVVYLFDTEIYRSPPEGPYGRTDDEAEELKREWTDKWEQFQVQAFKAWLSGQEKEET